MRRRAVVACVVGVGALVGTASAPAANLITNGSFESPDIATGTFGIFPSIPGWSWAPRAGTTSSGLELQDHVAGAPAPGAGDQFVELDSDGPTHVFQDVATVPGGLYRLTFLYSPRPNTAAAENVFQVTAGPAGAVFGPLASAGQTIWSPASLDFVADSSSSRIDFLDLGPEQAAGGLGAYVDAVSVERVNRPPDCSAVAPSQSSLWPPNHSLRDVTLSGATDPDGDPVTITITGVTQDEPVDDLGDASTAPDAVAGGTPDAVQLRAERSALGDGRVYRIAFTATDDSGASCSGTAIVGVPHERNGTAVDSGGSYDSFGS